MIAPQQNNKLSFHEWVEEYFETDVTETMKENEERAAYEYYVYIGLSNAAFERMI